MKLQDGMILLQDADTGKAYVRQLSDWECTMLLAQLSALDGGAVKVREIAPVIIRGANVSEERARHIVEKQQSLHLSARTGVKAFEDMAKAPGIAEQLIGQRHSGNPQQIPACEHHWIASEGRTASGWLCSKCGDYDGPGAPDDATQCYSCGQVTRQRLAGDEWHCKACHALQCERERCTSCGKTVTRPNGEHYCSRHKTETRTK